MFCTKCGAENIQRARFCKKCGEPLEENTQAGKNTDTVIEKVKKVPKMFIIGISVIVIVVAAIIFVSANLRKTIDLDKYLIIETEGYDHYGTARATIDWDAIQEKYESKISYTSDAQKEYGGLLKIMTPFDVVKASINVELDNNSGLSNGDIIRYSWKIDDTLKKYINCKVKFDDGEYKVSELEAVGTFDAFADLDVQFTGISPYGKVLIDYKGDEFSQYDFSCNKDRELKNGDIVTVSIDAKDMSYYANNLGKIPESLSNSYTVGGLQEYVEKYDDLTDTFIQEIRNETEDTIYAYTASQYMATSSLTDLKYEGYIMNVVKDREEFINYYNNLYIIYSGIVSNSEGKFSTSKVYFPVQFTNILRGEEITYESNNGIYGSSYLDGTRYNTKGYVNPLSCYIDVVDTNRDQYISESGDGFEKYAEYGTIGKLGDISDTYKEMLHADAKDEIESYIANSYSDRVEVKDLALVGEYMLIAKTLGTDFSKNNVYFVVYSATVSSLDGKFDAKTVYYPVGYAGIVKLPENEYMISGHKAIVGSSHLSKNWDYTKGYIDGNTMFSEIITSNRDQYRYEVSEGLKVFGE